MCTGDNLAVRVRVRTAVDVETRKGDNATRAILICRLREIDPASAEVEQKCLTTIMRDKRHARPSAGRGELVDVVAACPLGHGQKRIRLRLCHPPLRQCAPLRPTALNLPCCASFSKDDISAGRLNAAATSDLLLGPRFRNGPARSLRRASSRQKMRQQPVTKPSQSRRLRTHEPVKLRKRIDCRFIGCNDADGGDEHTERPKLLAAERPKHGPAGLEPAKAFPQAAHCLMRVPRGARAMTNCRQTSADATPLRS